MAENTHNVSTSNGNMRSLWIEGILSGGTIHWRFAFKSLYALNYNLTANLTSAVNASQAFRYNGTNVWNYQGYWYSYPALGVSHTVYVSVVVPAVSSTPSTTNIVGLTVNRPAQVPSAPGKPVVSAITNNSATVSWTASSASNGADISGYLLCYWPNSSASGPYVNHSTATSLSRSVTGLTPGQDYTFTVYAQNSVGYSAASAATTIKTLAGAWIRVSGVWRLCVPYVRTGGVWKMAVPYVRSGGTWRLTN